ncbi:MAG: sigma-70 family RNA polymerase sigma factor [Planctomycetota bacterium]
MRGVTGIFPGQIRLPSVGAACKVLRVGPIVPLRVLLLTEAELIAGCRSGDRRAQHELYARTAQRVYRLLLRMTRDPEQACELSQATYLRAFTHLGEFNGHSTVATWLCRIAINEALQAARRARLARTHEERVIAAAAGRRGPELPPHTRLDLEAALAALAPLDRAVLVLRYQEGLDYAAIASVLEWPPGTVASRLNRARHRLRIRLGPAYADLEEKRVVRHPTLQDENERAAGRPGDRGASP